MKLFILSITVFILTSSCSQKRNKLNSNEDELAAQIISEEKGKLETASINEIEQSVADTFPVGFRFQEDRSVDAKNPPKHLDILKSKENIRNFKLSDIASSIKYVKLETPPDSLLLWTHPKIPNDNFTLISDDKYLIIQGLYGISRFGMDGTFMEEVWKNNSGITVSQEIYGYSSTEFSGVIPDNPVSFFNGDLYMRFNDGPNRKVQFLKHKITEYQVVNLPDSQNEISENTIAGEELFHIQEKILSRMFGNIYGISGNSWAGIHDTWLSAKTGTILVVFSNEGDTLCTFTGPKIKNYMELLVRAGKPFSYQYKNQLTYLSQYSDTIFRLFPPNRLLPVFLLDFGRQKVDFESAINPKSDLSQKIMLYSIHETQENLLIRYTKNNASPQNRKNGNVTFYNAIYNKNENKLYHFPGQSSTEKNIQNDLDGGIPFWPEYVTPEGKMMMTTTGKKIKEYVKSDEFKDNEIPEEQRKKHIAMANELNDFDKLVVMTW